MTDEDIRQLASHYTMWSSHAGEGVADAENAAYEVGFRKAIELVDKLASSSNTTFYVYDTKDYTSQRLVSKMLPELKPFQ